MRSKWAAGKARGGRISKWIRNRRATQPPAHFHRNPLGRGQLAVFPRCSLLTYRFRYARRSRLAKQPTDRRRKTCLFRGQDTRSLLPLYRLTARLFGKMIAPWVFYTHRRGQRQLALPCALGTTTTPGTKFYRPGARIGVACCARKGAIRRSRPRRSLPGAIPFSGVPFPRRLRAA